MRPARSGFVCLCVSEDRFVSSGQDALARGDRERFGLRNDDLSPASNIRFLFAPRRRTIASGDGTTVAAYLTRKGANP